MDKIANSGIARLEKYEQSQGHQRQPEKRVSGRENIKWTVPRE
jgi:hypothetical protein